MKLDQPYYLQDFSGGQANNVNPNLVPDNCVDLGLNVDFDEELGSAVSRLGTAIVGAQLVDNKSVLGLFQHVDQADSTKNKLFAAINASNDLTSVIYDVTAGSTSLTGDTASLKCRFCNYNGDTLRLNGTDAPKAYNSTSWITSGGVFDLANMPTGYKFAKVFLSRVYLWGNASSPYTLAFSGILTSGTVSWSSGNGTVEIEPEDNGGEATGLGKVPGYILIFKRRSMHRWNFDSAFPEELVGIGAYSQESIVEGGGLCAFFSDSSENARGFYLTNGGRPQPISHDVPKNIKKFIDAISSSATIAGWATDRGFAWSVGDLTVDGETFSNVVLRYNRLVDQWSVRSYPTEFKCFAPYVVSGVNTIVGGDDDGTIYRIDKCGTYSDNGTAIRYKLRTRHEDFGSNNLKELTDKAVVRGKNLQGATISIIPDEDTTASAQQGSVTKFSRLLSLFGITRPISGNTLSVEVTGETTGTRAYIREIELPGIDVHPSYL
jgi:hypothetical protein